jgi:Fic family protein
VSGIAQFQLVHIHPFIDGNGRTARLLAMLVMYRGNYDFKRLFTLSEFYDRDPSAYYGALQRVRSHDMDMTGWHEYYVGGLATQMEEVKTKGELAIKAGSTGL